MNPGSKVLDSLSVYVKLMISSIRDVVLGWKFILCQIITLFLLGIVSFFFSRLGFVGSILLSIVFSFALSFYLALIKALVNKEKFIAESIKEEGLELFSPVISCFFSLFLIQLILSILKLPSFFSMAISILISVFFNPVLEIIYLEGGSFSDIINRSLNFVINNFFIWFFPIFLLLTPFVLGNPRFLLEAFTVDPLNLLRSVIENFSYTLNILSLNIAIPMLYGIAIFLVFRGRLFTSIENKSRIKKWW